MLTRGTGSDGNHGGGQRLSPTTAAPDRPRGAAASGGEAANEAALGA